MYKKNTPKMQSVKKSYSFVYDFHTLFRERQRKRRAKCPPYMPVSKMVTDTSLNIQTHFIEPQKGLWQ